ncbi:MAG: hypothetical protein NVS9B10_07170 [Nevskia sp.]
MNEPLPTPRTVAAGRGADWIADGYALFRKDAAVWIGIAVLWILLVVAGSSASGLVSLALNVLAPVITGGLMLGCEAQRRGEALRIEHLWAGFGDGHAGPLILLGVFSLVGLLLVGLGVVVVLGATVGGALLSGGGIESLEIGVSAILGLLVTLLLLTPVVMALWFAPALVVLHGLEPLAALKASFRGSLRNILSLSVNGLLLFVIAIVASIPLGLGWLIALPVITASIYFGYRDIFVAEPAMPENTP